MIRDEDLDIVMEYYNKTPVEKAIFNLNSSMYDKNLDFFEFQAYMNKLARINKISYDDIITYYKTQSVREDSYDRSIEFVLQYYYNFGITIQEKEEIEAKLVMYELRRERE